MVILKHVPASMSYVTQIFAGQCQSISLHSSRRRNFIFHQDTIVIDWYGYASDGCTAPKNKKLLFHLPFDTTDLQSDSHHDVLLETCHVAKVCTFSLTALLQLGRYAWQSIVDKAKTTGIAKPHGNIGNQNSAISDDAKQ
jgi:hypothetical protein